MNKTQVSCWQQSILAYTDNTTWIARSKEEMQKIIDILTEFYKLNDIELNSRKSELLVLNHKTKNKEQDNISKIRLDKLKEIVRAKKGKEAIDTLESGFQKKEGKNITN